MLRRACLALPQTETTPIGPLTLRSTLRACGGISNFPVSVEYLTSSRGEPGCAAGAEKLLVSTGLAFLPPHMNDIVSQASQVCLLVSNPFASILQTLCPGSKAHNTTQDLKCPGYASLAKLVTLAVHRVTSYLFFAFLSRKLGKLSRALVSRFACC